MKSTEIGSLSPSPHGGHEGWGEGWFLQTLNSHRTRRTGRPRLTVSTRSAALAAIGLVNEAALGLATRARFTARPGHTTVTAGHLNLDQFRRVITRHFQPNQCTRRARLTVAAITAIGTATGLAPGTTRCLTVGPIETDETRCARAAASVHQQLRRTQCLDLQVQVTPGAGGLEVSPRRAASRDLAAFRQLRTTDLQLKRLFAGHDGDPRFTTQMQFTDG